MTPPDDTTLPVANGRSGTPLRPHDRAPVPADALGRAGAARPRRAGRTGGAAADRRPRRVRAGRAPPSATSTRSSRCWPAFLVAQTVLTRYARYVSQALGEQVLAELREDFVANTLALPVGVVESAGSGDLLTRTGRDVDQLGWSVRWALPEWTIALVTAVVTFVAALSVGPVGRDPVPARPAAAGDRAAVVPRPGQGRLPARGGVVLPDQRHPHRDRRGRPHGRGARARRGADRGDRRRHQGVVRRGEVHPLPAHGVLPEHGAVLPDPDGVDPAARWLPLHAGHRLAGRRHRGDALRADADRPGRPDRLDPRRAPARCRVAGATPRRRRGARRPRGDRAPAGRARSSVAEDVRFSYVDGRDVLHGVDLDVAPGERIAMVGPSARASRRWAGCSRASTRPARAG